MDEFLMNEIMDTVSSGDAGASVSGNNVYYQIEIYTVSGSDADAGPQYTLFDKPLEDYTVSEGLLLILVVLLVGKYVWSAIKEGFKWLSW